MYIQYSVDHNYLILHVACRIIMLKCAVNTAFIMEFILAQYITKVSIHYSSTEPKSELKHITRWNDTCENPNKGGTKIQQKEYAQLLLKGF